MNDPTFARFPLLGFASSRRSTKVVPQRIAENGEILGALKGLGFGGPSLLQILTRLDYSDTAQEDR